MLRIAIAGFLGLMIGHERKNRNKSAGIRTHAIVSMGSALMIIVSKYGFADSSSFDAARIAAQVVSGIGFLGAGVIFVRNNLVNGLTTAAGIWATAGVGLAMGSGLYVVGISSAVMLLILQDIMHRISYFAAVASGGMIRLTLVRQEGIIKQMEDFLEQERVDVTAVKILKNKKEEIKIEFEVIYPPGCDKARIFSRMTEMDSVITVSD